MAVYKEKKMQKQLCWLALAVGILGAVPASLADPGILAPKAAIQSEYDKIYVAARHRDMTSAAHYFSVGFLSEDRVNTPSNRTPPMDLAQLHKMAANYEAVTQTLTGHAVIEQLVLNGNHATVTVRHHVLLSERPESKTRKPVWDVVDAVPQDTWVREPQGWLMQYGRGVSLQWKKVSSSTDFR